MDKYLLNERSGEIAVGLYDIPYSPQATVLSLNLLKSNAIIFGSSMSGKTTMVKNILARMNEEQPYTSWENTYILDFGNNIGGYSGLGRVCACFDNSNEENIKRIFKIVEQNLAQNTRELNGENYLAYQEKHPERPLLHTTLVIENVTAFLAEDRYALYHESLSKIVRDGVSKGVSVLLTATDLTGVLGRLMVHFSRKFALEMQRDKYLEIFGMKVDEPMNVPGRGVTLIGSTPCEFQAYLPFSREEDLNRLISVSEKFGVEKLKSFPAELTSDNLAEFCPSVNLRASSVLVGLDYYDHSPIALDFEDAHNIAIYGKKQFGKTNLLRVILRGAYGKYPGAHYVFFDDGREQLTTFRDEFEQDKHADVRYCNQFKEFNAILRQVESGSFPADGKPIFFILQNKMLYSRKRQNSDGRIADGFYLTDMMTQAEARNQYFIFSDIPKIADKFAYEEFNPLINVAFLLDSIGDFIAEKGSSSVFNSMDSKEMKREYARCDVGDGYYYDVDREELRKFKVMKSKGRTGEG